MNRHMVRRSRGRNEMIRRAEYLVHVHRREKDFSFAVKDCAINFPVPWFHRSRPTVCHILYPHCYDADHPRWVLDCSDILVERSHADCLEKDYRGFKIFASEGRFYALARDEGGFSIESVQRGRYRRCYVAASKAEACKAVDRSLAAGEAKGAAPKPSPSAPKPTRHAKLIEAYRRFNIIAYSGRYYALAQGEGRFSPVRFREGGYKHCYVADSVAEARREVDRQLD